MPVSVAIVGSGPAGCYAIEALLESDHPVKIDVIERLPTPFGLVRAGVAPDHQTTKSVARKFEAFLESPHVRYFGNVSVGHDVTLADLRRLYDAVVLAIGAPRDRPLGIPGADKKGVFGAAAFVGWYNGHPDFRHLAPDLATPGVAVIGNGNVAVDVARVLAHSPAELADSDIPEYAAEAIARAPIADIWMFGRRGPHQAKFTNAELRELGRLGACVPLVDVRQLDADSAPAGNDRARRLAEKNLATLRGFAANRADGTHKRLHIAFFARPVEVLGGERVEGLRLERTRIMDGDAVGAGEFFEVPCGLVVAAIGYRAIQLDGAPFDPRTGTVPNADGRVELGLYCVGWLKRGPTGVIASNRADGETVATMIAADFPDGIKPGREALGRLLAERGVRPVTLADWKEIDQAEIAAAPPGAPRRKFVTVADMLAVLDRR